VAKERQPDAPRKMAERVMADFQALGALVGSQSQAVLEAELTRHQMKAVLAIGEGGTLSVGALAHRLDISLPTASQLVERLVTAGVVERAADPSDRRVVLCGLTDRGADIHREVTQVMPARLSDWLVRLDVEELESLHRGLGALVALARVQTPVPTQQEGGGGADAGRAN
jgi:DNA-binding MarR family transcriptional regulator